MSITLLRAVLLVRCVVCLLFAWKLHGAQPPTLESLVDWFAPFAIVDGILGVALAWLVVAVRWGTGVAALALVDGLLSIAWGVVLQRWPGIPGVSVSAVLFSGLLSALSGLIGLFQLVLAVQLRRRSGSRIVGVSFGAMGAAFMVLTVLDFHLRVTPLTEWKLLIGQALLQGLAFGVIAVASRRVLRIR